MDERGWFFFWFKLGRPPRPRKREGCSNQKGGGEGKGPGEHSMVTLRERRLVAHCNALREAARSFRARLAPRTSTWSTPRRARFRLMTSPAWPPPTMMTSVVCMMSCPSAELNQAA